VIHSVIVKQGGAPGDIVSRSRDTHQSVLKAVSWRTLGTLDTFAISWFFTGRIEIAGSIAALEIATKIAWYYLHERVWAAILDDESGATAIEYCLTAVGLSIVIITAVNGIGTNLNAKFTSINSSLK